MNTKDFVEKLDLIITHRDPSFDFKSDRINNAYNYAKGFAKQNPELAQAIINEVDTHLMDYCETLEIHPERLSDLINSMKKVLS